MVSVHDDEESAAKVPQNADCSSTAKGTQPEPSSMQTFAHDEESAARVPWHENCSSTTKEMQVCLVLLYCSEETPAVCTVH